MNNPRDAVIVEVIRTPVGKMRKSLSSIEPHVLAAMTIKKLIEKAGIDPELIDDVIFGNLMNYNYANIARIAVLEAGLPISVPGITVNRQCSSSLNAVTFAANSILSGMEDVLIAGGVESYSKQPFMIKKPEAAYPFALEFAPVEISSKAVGDPSMIQTAENLAKKYGITRQECDEFALESQQKAAAAWEKGFYDGETFPIEIPQRKGDPIVFKMDECVRPDTSMEGLSRLRPVMKDGVVTAGNASPMNDGASAVLVMSRAKAEELGLKPMAKITAYASAGVDPNIMGIGPVYSTRNLMQKTGLNIDDFDIIELNEAFAVQSIAVIKELNIDMKKLNPNGGAIAIGHPNGASGGLLTCRTVRHMVEKDLKRGLITFCCGGGQGFSCMVERD